MTWVRMSTTLSSRDEKKSITGCKASIAFFTACVAPSSSFSAPANLMARLAMMPIVAIAGEAERAWKPFLRPSVLPCAIFRPLPKASTAVPSPLKALW